MYDALIIGAGMSGLAAGVRLAQFGLRVAILERHTTVGGLNSFYRLDGRNYDVGLHAVTNFRPKEAKQGPLPRVLRQLRLSWDDFGWVPQTRSSIIFPGARLEFTNDIRFLESEIERQFPGQIDSFRRLTAALLTYDNLDAPVAACSARAVLASFIADPMLVEMLICPLLFYGSAAEHDTDFGQASVMFRSIFLEGFARPAAGVRTILKLLVRRFKEAGGEVLLRAGVRRIVATGGVAREIELDDGRTLTAEIVLSSAGWCETVRLCDPLPPGNADIMPGQLSFVESIAVIDRKPAALGYHDCVTFFNDSDRFDWQKPGDRLVDLRSGVVCSPDNFAAGETSAGEGKMRVTALANFERWAALAPSAYTAEKATVRDAMYESAARFVPDFRQHIVAGDTFTPTTIRHYTGHDNGAVYGAPFKHRDGTTHLKNLFICGNDQGFVGIVGAMMSGVLVANQHCLKRFSARNNDAVIQP
jgi:phytoene dehydrogenase-like protein